MSGYLNPFPGGDVGFGANEKHFKFSKVWDLKRNLCRKGPISKHISQGRRTCGPRFRGWSGLCHQGEVKEGSLAVGHRFEEF